MSDTFCVPLKRRSVEEVAVMLGLAELQRDECHALLLDMATDTRPLAGGWDPKIRKLLVRHGIISPEKETA